MDFINENIVQLGIIIQTVSCIGSLLVASSSIWISIYIYNKNRPLFVIGKTELHIPEKNGNDTGDIRLAMEVENKGASDSFIKDPRLVVFEKRFFFQHTVKEYELVFLSTDSDQTLEPNQRRIEIPGYESIVMELAVQVSSSELETIFRDTHYQITFKTHRGVAKYFLDL